jgi:hypothetical protein
MYAVVAVLQQVRGGPAAPSGFDTTLKENNRTACVFLSVIPAGENQFPQK